MLPIVKHDRFIATLLAFGEINADQTIGTAFHYTAFYSAVPFDVKTYTIPFLQHTAVLEMTC